MSGAWPAADTSHTLPASQRERATAVRLESHEGLRPKNWRARARERRTGPSEGREELATHHPVFDVRDAGRLDRPDLFELDLGAPEVVEEASAAPEEHRDDVQLELV
jgi:hypothetical protein